MFHQHVFGTYRLQGNVCEEAVFQALSGGYRVIDTAVLYRNHADVGRGLQRAIEAGIVSARSDVCVITKVSDKDQRRGGEAIKSVHTPGARRPTDRLHRPTVGSQLGRAPLERHVGSYGRTGGRRSMRGTGHE